MDNCIENLEFSVTSCLKSALQGRDFVMAIEDTEDSDQIVLTVDLPLKPEDGGRIDPIKLTINVDGSISFEYTLIAKFCISQERGVIAANTINEAMFDVPMKCVYCDLTNEFSIFSISSTKHLIQAINRLLSILEFLIILQDFMRGDDSNKDSAFDCIFSVGDYANKTTFEDFNIVN